MPDNKNENNESLFTQMFGLASEQPETLPPKEEKVTQEPVTETIEEKPAVEQIIIKANAPVQENNGVFQNSLNQLNQTTTSPVTSNPKEQQITLSPTTQKEETIFLSDEPIKQNVQPEKLEEEEEPPKFDPNSIPTEPYEYTPSNNFDDYPLENASKSSVIMKIFLVILCVGGLIGGWILLYSTVLAPEDVQTPNNNQQEEIEEPVEEEKEEEQPEPPAKIDFSPSLSFYKGLTDNPDELNREYPFEPVNQTGVVLCEFINPLTDGDTVVEFKAYIYYENYLTKKTYFEQINKVKNQSKFQEYVDAAQVIEEEFEDTESLSATTKIDNSNKIVTVGLFSNLAYGSYSNLGDTGMIFKTNIDYDDNVKTAMAQIYGAENYIGNIKCSSVKTS